MFGAYSARAVVPCLMLSVTLVGCGDLVGGDAASTAFQPEIRLELPADDTGDAIVALAGLPATVLDRLDDGSLERDEWTAFLRVTVRQPNGGDDDVPAVIGDYSVGPDDTVRFTPMFPFDEGREYTVTVDASALSDGAVDADVHVEVVSIPEVVREPTASVTRVFPSGDSVPANQLKLYIEFSAPMSDVDGLEYIRLVDGGGSKVDAPFLPLGEEFWDHDYRRYTVFFDPGRVKQGIRPNEELGRPLQAGETYTLVVDPAWPDAEGTPLASEYRRTFTVGAPDETPLDLETWRLRVPPAGTTSRLVVSFPEPLDHGLLTRGLGLEDENGSVAGAVEISNWETRWSFTPAEPWRSGAYSLVALSILEDLAGNRVGVPFEIDVFERVDEPSTDEPDTHRIPFEIP